MFEVSYLVWAFGLSALVYAAMRFPAEHLDPSANETVALWLNEQDTRLWAKHFTTLFDKVMGEHSLSRKRLVRSLMATGISVTCLWLLFSPVLGLMETRADSSMTLSKLLVLGLVVNALADYLSLAQTRWVLRVFQTRDSAALHGLFFFFDFVASAAIVVAIIGVYRISNGERPLTVVELTAGYTPYSVLFYSTFLSSVWAWIFVSSSMTIKTFSQLGLSRFLDTWNRPFAQIALFSSVLVFLVLMGIRPIVEKVDRHELDEWVCQKFGGYSCTHAARLSDDDVKRLELLEIACQTGDERQCARSIATLEPALVDRALEYWRDQCLEHSNNEACWVAGKMVRHARGAKQDFPEAIRMFEIGCQLGNLDACSDLGEMYTRGLGTNTDYAKAFEIFEDTCNAGNARSCHNLGGMYEYGAGVEQDYAEAQAIYSCGCLSGDAQACTSLSRMYFTGSGVPVSRSRAATLLQRVVQLTNETCSPKNPEQCNDLEFVVCTQ